jgi:hypothetical protein
MYLNPGDDFAGIIAKKEKFAVVDYSRRPWIGLLSPCGLSNHQGRQLLRSDVPHVLLHATAVAGIQINLESLDLPVELNMSSSSQPTEHSAPRQS